MQLEVFLRKMLSSLFKMQHMVSKKHVKNLRKDYKPEILINLPITEKYIFFISTIMFSFQTSANIYQNISTIQSKSTLK